MHIYQEENQHRGRIEVICGSMFSGKTEELIRRLKRAKIARQRVEIYKLLSTLATRRRTSFRTTAMPSPLRR